MAFQFEFAPDIQRRIREILANLNFSHINSGKLICFRSRGSTSRARARIWSLPRIWQKALGIDPHYVIEILSERFDRESQEEQTKILIHELLHIPKTFSGALLPHRGRNRRHIDARAIELLFREYRAKRNNQIIR